jgi:hypothetical protein
MNTTQHKDPDRSQLFLVRLWAEESRAVGTGNEDRTNGKIEWCGKLQHVVSGRARYFDGLSNLAQALEKMIEPEKG